MTPTDTMTPARPTPDNPTDPCVCGHSRRNHGEEDDRAVCFVCTHPHGGCRGFITSRELIDPTAAERDAFMAGFRHGELWAVTDRDGSTRYVPDRTDEAAERAYVAWIEGGEDA